MEETMGLFIFSYCMFYGIWHPFLPGNQRTLTSEEEGQTDAEGADCNLVIYQPEKDL